MILTSTVFDWSTRVTDGQTDGRAIAYTRYSIYAVARKNCSYTGRLACDCTAWPTWRPATVRSALRLIKPVFIRLCLEERPHRNERSSFAAVGYKYVIWTFR